MLKKRIIPCLLLKNGRCVKGINFKNHRDVGHPITNAKIYNAQGADELIFLDIAASIEQRGLLIDIIKQTAEQCFMPLTVGGGIKEITEITQLLRAGADKASVNTIALEKPDFLAEAAQRFGRQCVVVSIDYKMNKQGKYEVFSHSGAQATGKNPVFWAKQAAELGAGEILLTNIDKEGVRSGYDKTVLKQVSQSLDIPVIASGGAGSLADLKEAIVECDVSAVSLASILHFTDQNVIKARDYLITNGIDVRINV